jgi:ABC-type transport system substrate-binding protein
MARRDEHPQISKRRGPVLRAVSAALAAVLASVLLGACDTGDSSPAENAQGSGGTSSEGEPVDGGRLKVAFTDDMVNIGTTWWGGYGFTIGYALFDQLVRLTPDGRGIEPELLEELPVISDDQRTLSFTLRRGVTFHNGTEMTAEDVKYSLERQIDPDGPGQAQSLYGGLGIVGTTEFVEGGARQIDGLKVTGRYTLEMRLDEPNSAVPYALTLTMASIVPKAYTEKVGSEEFEQKPVGSGPFELTDYKPGQSLTMDRFEDYWDSERAAHVDGVDWQLNVDADLAILRILNGELDLLHRAVPPGQLQKLRNDPAQKDNLKSASFNNVFYVAGSTKHPALKDVKVRQALAYAVDKEKIVRQLGGVGTPATGGFFSPSSPYYQEALSYPYDPERAKELLAEAGFGDGFDLELLIENRDPVNTIGQALEQDWSAIGVDVDANQLPAGPWSERAFEYDPIAVIGQWELPYPHGSYVVDGAFTKAAIESGCCNFAQFWSPQLEDLVKQGHLSSEPAELKSTYEQIDTVVTKDQALWIPIIYPEYVALKSSRVGGYEVPTTPDAEVLFLNEYWIKD